MVGRRLLGEQQAERVDHRRQGHRVDGVERPRDLLVAVGEVDDGAIARHRQKHADADVVAPGPVVVERVGERVDAVGDVADRRAQERLGVVDERVAARRQRRRAVGRGERLQPAATDLERGLLRRQIAAPLVGRARHRAQLGEDALVEPRRRDAESKTEPNQVARINFRVELADYERGFFVVTVAEDLDCSGIPVCSEEICTYDEGFIAGLLLAYSERTSTSRKSIAGAPGGGFAASP